MQNIQAIFDSFSDKQIIIVGDVMIDTYIKGKVNRISPEAPVPVVQFQSKENRLGGAANVALNIKAMGAKPYICTVIGEDDDALLLERLVNENHLSKAGIIKSDTQKTTVKTRIIGNNQQLLRIDQEETQALPSNLEFALIERIKSLVEKETIDAIIFQDYNKGVLTPKVIEEIIEFANSKEIPTTVDPKKENFLAYKGVTLFKPNLKELKEGIDIHFDFNMDDKQVFIDAVEALKSQLQPKYTFITLSEHGVYMNDGEEHLFVPAHLRNITDVSGAGDTVISIATLALSAKLSPKDVAQLSNLAGGLVCEKVGVISIDKEQLLAEALKLN